MRRRREIRLRVHMVPAAFAHPLLTEAELVAVFLIRRSGVRRGYVVEGKFLHEEGFLRLADPVSERGRCRPTPDISAFELCGTR